MLHYLIEEGASVMAFEISPPASFLEYCVGDCGRFDMISGLLNNDLKVLDIVHLGQFRGKICLCSGLHYPQCSPLLRYSEQELIGPGS